MGTMLEKLMESIDPSQILNRISQAVDAAFNSFRYHYPIKSFDDYQKCMSQFVQHIEQVVLGFKSSHDYDQTFFWTRYSSLVNGRHGRDAWKMNYEKIITGKEGGLYQLLKEVAGMILKDRSKQQISNRIGPFWDSLSDTEKLNTIQEFMTKFGDILPSEYRGGGGAYLKMNFPNMLQKYPELILEIRRAVR